MAVHTCSNMDAWQGWPGKLDWYTYFVSYDWPPSDGVWAFEPGDQITFSNGRFQVDDIRTSKTDPDQGYPGALGIHVRLTPLETWPAPEPVVEVLRTEAEHD